LYCIKLRIHTAPISTPLRQQAKLNFKIKSTSYNTNGGPFCFGTAKGNSQQLAIFILILILTLIKRKGTREANVNQQSLLLEGAKINKKEIK
jgi:hypothetical protein